MLLHKSLFALLLTELLSHGSEIQAMPSEKIVQQQVYLLKDLMVELHKIHKFENIIIYQCRYHMHHLKNLLLLRNLDQDEALYDEISYKSMGSILAKNAWSPQLQRPLMSFIITPQEYINNTDAIPNLGKFLTNKNLAVVILNDIVNYEAIEFVALSLGACLETKIVFLLIGHKTTNVFPFVSLEKLKKFFRWCWSKNLLNVILLFQSVRIDDSVTKGLKLEVLAYTPFSHKSNFIRLTDKHPKDYFPSRTTDVLGFDFKTPVIADKPLVFKWLDPFTGQEIVTGISGKIYTEYVKHINATFKEMKNDNINGSWTKAFDYISGLLENGSIQISLHPLTALVANKFPKSYPISNTNNCVVVPFQQYIYPGYYIARTLSLEMWLLLLVLFVTFQIAYMIINYDNYGALRPWLAFSITLRGLLSIPVDNMGPLRTISKNSLSWKRKICMHMLLLLAGIIYCQTHTAALSSFLSSTLYPEQIESLEDLVKANLSIMMVDYIYDTYKYLDLLPANFSKNLVLTDPDTVSKHLHQLDTRYAYTVYNEEWKVMQYMQMRLSKPRFKILSPLCISNVYLALPMRQNSPFYDSFKNFILRSQSAGIDIKWRQMVYWQIHTDNGLNVLNMSNPDNFSPLGLQHLTYILYIYVGGLVVAGFVFLIELLLPHMGRNLTQYKSKEQV